LLTLPILVAQARRLDISNPEFSSSIVFSGHRICSVGFETPDGVLSASSQAPVFEMCIGGRVVSSADPFWNYAGSEIQSLSNDGTVVSYKFRGRKALRGLTLVWDREYFHGDAFVRERMRLRADKGRNLVLNNVDGAQHLIFPRYSFDAPGRVKAEELRIATFRPRRKFPDHHMNHPDSIFFELGETPRAVKGPFLILDAGDYQILSSYEHASEDLSFMKGPRQGAALAREQEGNDADQSVSGNLDYISDDDLWFIASEASLRDGVLTMDNHIRRGGYLDGEAIPQDRWYETVWSTISLLRPEENPYDAIRAYLYDKITTNKRSREADFYYNTWSMARPREVLYTSMTEERLLQEIDMAAEMGIQTFVIDDGWELRFGDWTARPSTLPNGFKPLIDRMKQHGITPGIWISLLGAHPDCEYTREHEDCLILDVDGKPIRGQWKNPVYDIVGPVSEHILEQLKALTDEGFRFFKFDAIDTFSSTLDNQWHGDGRWSRRERLDRYNYLLPFYVTDIMRRLREYCPDVVIENDLTEADRCMVGLMPLQEGKLYFQNNGASRYNDYSARRSRSMRAVINEYCDFFPQEIFTYAFYPEDKQGSMMYNVTSSLQAGHGFWGNLSSMTPAQRAEVSATLEKARQVLLHVKGRPVERSGMIDSSPEIYIQRNPENGYALFTAFSRESVSRDVVVDVPAEKVLGVLGHAFELKDKVLLPLRLKGKDAFASAFVMGGSHETRVLASTGALEDVILTRKRLTVKAKEDCTIKVQLPGRTAAADIKAGESVSFDLL